MKTYNDYAQLTSDNNLKCEHITGSANGYPTPYLGAFIHGFDNFDEALVFAENNDGQTVLCKKRDGWNTVTLHSVMFRELNYKDYLEDLGELYRVINKDEIFYLLSELQDSGLDCDLLADELRDIAKLSDQLNECEGNNEVLIKNMDTDEYFTSKKTMMSYHEDVWTWTVGVQLSN